MGNDTKGRSRKTPPPKITTIAALFDKLGTATIAKHLGKEGYIVKKKIKKSD